MHEVGFKNHTKVWYFEGFAILTGEKLQLKVHATSAKHAKNIAHQYVKYPKEYPNETSTQ